MKQKLLIDSVPMKLTLEEGKDGVSRLVARGEYARYDKETENKRLYPKSLWSKNFARLAEGLTRKRVFGELDHPGDGKTKLQRVSHVTTGLKVQGDGVIHGESEILDTPNGRILKELLKAGCEVGVSSRGFGSTSTNKEGVEVVGDDYRLLAFDFVADPADKTAYPEIFAEESKIPEDDMELTLEKLKADYPDLVKMIGEEAATEAKKLAEEKAKSKEEQDKAIQDAVAAAETRIEESMKDKFSKELIAKMEEVKAQAEEKVRGELLSDPDVAGAKGILEMVVAAVKPLMLPDEVKAEVKTKDEEIADLKKIISERDLELANKKSEISELANVAKRAAFSLYLEKKLVGMPEEQAKAVRELIGDVTAYEETEDLDKRIDAIQEELERQSEEGQVSSEEIAKRDEEIERLKAENEELRGSVDQVRDLAEQLQLQVYVEGKLANHPQSKKLRKVLENASTTEEVDELMESFEPASGPDSDEAARIRARVNRGQQRDIEEDTDGGDGSGDALPHYEGAVQHVHGVPITEIAEMAGIHPQRR